MASPVLRATGVSVLRRHVYRDSDNSARTLIDDVNLSVNEGERVAIIGRSGSGKSLLATALSGTIPATLSLSGDVSFNGHPVSGKTLGSREIVVVRQDSADSLNPLVTIAKQMAIPLRARGVADSFAAEYLARVGIEDPERTLHSYPGQLSGGQRQRVCIALGLACAPQILITDECTTALDVINQASVVTALETVDTLVFITHDLALAAQLCTRVIVMDQGRIVESAPISEVLNNPLHDITASLVRQAQHRDRSQWVA